MENLKNACTASENTQEIILESLIEQLDAVNKQLKLVQERKSSIEEKLKDTIAGEKFTFLTSSGLKLSLSRFTQSRSSFNYKLLKEEYPKVWDKHRFDKFLEVKTSACTKILLS